jgi:hypothetical protein
LLIFKSILKCNKWIFISNSIIYKYISILLIKIK